MIFTKNCQPSVTLVKTCALTVMRLYVFPYIVSISLHYKHFHSCFPNFLTDVSENLLEVLYNVEKL